MKMFDVYAVNDITITKGQGSWVWDDKGTRYLDMYGGHAVISIGHTNPDYVAAVTSQLNELGFYSNSVIIARQKELTEKLGAVSGKNDYQLFLCNSGAEANENAMKLASFHTGRSKIVAFKGAFHGRTSLAVATTDNPKIVAPVNRTDNVVFLPYNNCEALTRYFEQNGEQVAGVIIEAIQGVGGIKLASNEFLKLVRSLCDTYGTVYIADEVQCGCGRSGKYYATDHAGVDADIYTMAKGIGNGFPIGAISISPKIQPTVGMLGTTFGGNHLACSAAIAVAEVISRDSLMDNAAETGRYLLDRLRDMPQLADVRGKGLMIGADLPIESAPLRRRLLFEEKIFVGAAGKNTVRLLPALNVSRQQADMFLTAFGKLLTEMC